MSELAVGSLKGLAANSFVIDIAAGSTLNVPPPAILQVVSVVKTDAQTGTVAAGGVITVTNFSPSITPVSASSTLLHIVGAPSYDQGTTVRITGGVAIPLGDAASGKESAVAGSRLTSARSGVSTFISFVDTPGSTATLTYGMDLVNANDLTRTFTMNRGQLDSDFSSRTTTTWTIMEVAG